jgi:hypothetical protein
MESTDDGGVYSYSDVLGCLSCLQTPPYYEDLVENFLSFYVLFYVLNGLNAIYHLCRAFVHM